MIREKKTVEVRACRTLDSPVIIVLIPGRLLPPKRHSLPLCHLALAEQVRAQGSLDG